MKNLIVALLVTSSTAAIAQKKVWLDENKFNVFDPAFATYYRVVEPDSNLFLIRDFYLATDQPEMTATASRVKPEIIFDGKLTSYYENGKMNSEGEYEDNKRVGVWKLYHENGQLAQETLHVGEKTTYKQCWDDSGTPLLMNGTGRFTRKSSRRGESDQHFEIENSEVLGAYQIEASGDTLYLVPQEIATYKGGLEGLYRTIRKTLRYPGAARRSGVEGRVFIEFTVDKSGRVQDIRCLKGIGSGCDEEAIRVLRMMNSWTPATMRGRAVRQRFVLPLEFKLG